MKKVSIKKLTLSQWRGQSREIAFSHKTVIKGRNEDGKSTIFNAWLWLLTGVDEFDRSNFQLFDNTKPQTHENAMPASVEAIIDVDGNEYTFKKTAKQGWQRVKGSSEYTRKGADDYSFQVDGIELSATQYKQQIEALFAPIDKLKIMLNLRYFFMLDWKEMRKELYTIIDDIDPADFKGDYNSIMQDLGKYTTDELKAKYKQQINEIKRDVNILPKTIEVLQSNLPDLHVADEARKAIDEARRQITNIDRQIADASDFAKPYIERRNAELAEISRLQDEYNAAEKIYDANAIEEIGKIQEEIKEVDFYNEGIENFNKKAQDDKDNAKQELKNMNELLIGLRKRHEELTAQNKECKNRVFMGDKCAYCGQELPKDKLEEARKRFNEQKERDHAYIVAQGKSNRAYLDRALKCVENLEAELAKPIELREKKDKSHLEAELANIKASIVPYSKSIEGSAKLAVIKEKQANLTVIPQQDNNELLCSKFALLDEIEINSKKLGMGNEYDKQVTKIKSLQKELKEKSAEVARIEGKLAKIKDYEEEKARIISDKVNSKFEYICVEMSDTNKSGDIVPACIIKDYKGVNALVTNNASKILCGLDISLAFQQFYSLQMPMFVDNAESINDDKLPNIDGQTIIMKVVDDCNFTVLCQC